MFDFGELLRSDGKRFFDEDMFACFQGFDHKFGMRVMLGKNGNYVNVWIVDDFVIARSSVFETEFFT